MTDWHADMKKTERNTMDKPTLTIGNLIACIDARRYWGAYKIEMFKTGSSNVSCYEAAKSGEFIRICFMTEEGSWVTLPIDSPMLVPYYDVVPEGLCVEGSTLICWISEYDAFPWVKI